MGLFTLSLAGGSLLLIGAWESLISTSTNPISSSPSSSSPLNKITAAPPKTISQPPISSNNKPYFSTVTLSGTALFSLLFFLNSSLSFLDAFNSKDKIGSALQLQVLAASLLFLMFSILGLLNNLSNSISFPYSLINLVVLFAFVEEFLLFYLQRKDPSGIENRYYDLMLVPIAVCVFSTLIELKSPRSNMPRLTRGIGLILQGTWFLQMGLSFYTDLMSRNCSLMEKSRGNFTIKCKGHMDYHRGRAIAVLLFNCHLAFLVTTIVGVYSVVGKKIVRRGDFMLYRPLGAEMQPMDGQAQFTLESDEDDDGIKKLSMALHPGDFLMHRSTHSCVDSKLISMDMLHGQLSESDHQANHGASVAHVRAMFILLSCVMFALAPSSTNTQWHANARAGQT
ncbi:hypothetical protein Nepgr_001189 [Nepenthes gracilis]|uniref:Uncharacterized protein n=1 Tax=Nepenthes gracilis TaxID=150966 RepID=A0AAD3P5L6_NEPGR|nr:hypothetical protein Nepgr_001189 [Nepenthes gracilis]